MNLKNCILRSVAAGLALFVLGWIIYGFLLDPSGVAEEPIMWAIVIGSLLNGALLTMVLGWKRASGAAEGAKAGGLFGLLMALAGELMVHGTMAAGPTLSEVVRDGLVSLVMYGVAGSVVGMLAARGDD